MSNGVVPWQVRHIAFEYEDVPGSFKVRPVVVCTVDEEIAVVMPAKVTGHGPRLEYPGEIRLVDWETAGLSKPSVVHCSKTVEVDIGDMASAELIGSLSDRDASSVADGLLAVGKIQTY